ncbi:MAG: hypothetical protein MUC36_12145 [Planctomycetes bacterium]|nr:hypothetical protein [Planctomycetota bacterium]
MARVCWSLVLLLTPMLAQVVPPADPLGTLAALPVAPAVSNGQRIVVQEADGSPAAAAIVVFATEDAAEAADRAAAAAGWFLGDEPRMQAHRLAGGSRYRLDERGAVRVPALSGRVLAMHDGRFATARVPHDASGTAPRLLLKLAPVREFEAQVVDAEGAPAAQVLLAAAYSPGGAVTLANRTDAAGRARFRMFSELPKTAVVQLQVPTRQPVAVALPREAPAVVRLQLPVVVPLTVRIGGGLLPGSEVKWFYQQTGGRQFAARPAIGTEAVFPYLEPGVEGNLQVWIDGQLSVVPLPPIAASPAPFEWQPAPKPGRVVLRLLDPKGAPLLRAQLECRWEWKTGGAIHRAVSNAAGWVEVQPPTNVKNKAQLQLLAPAADGLPPSACRIDYRRHGDQTVQLGDVQLAEQPVAIAGVFVDAAGQPVPHVRFRAEHTSFTTAADGSFEMRLPEPVPAELRLHLATQHWYFHDPVARSRSFPAGARQRVVLEPAGRVRFAAAGIPRGAWSDFEFRLEPAGGGGEPLTVDLQLYDQEWLLPGGHWNLVVLHTEQEVHRIADLRIAPGIENHDPRCMEFDWRAFAALVTIRVEDQAGRPSDTAMVRHQFGDRPEIVNSRGTNRGLSHGVVPKDGGTISVRPMDETLPEIELGRITGEHVVRLGSGPRLRVELSTPPRLPPGGELLLLPNEGAEAVPFSAAGAAQVWLAANAGCAPRIVVRVASRQQVVWQAENCQVAAGGRVLPVDGAVVQRAIDLLFPQ